MRIPPLFVSSALLSLLASWVSNAAAIADLNADWRDASNPNGAWAVAQPSMWTLLSTPIVDSWR
jgi:hypothetical protein